MSQDGKEIAYTISRSGSDWTEIYVIDAKTLKPLPDHIEWGKFTGAVWRTEGINGRKGFFYSAYPRPEAGKEFSNANEYHNIYFHELNTPQSADILVYTDPKNPLHFHSAGITHDERWLVVSTGGQGVGCLLYTSPSACRQFVKQTGESHTAKKEHKSGSQQVCESDKGSQDSREVI